jgi:hypothetical protein
MPAVKIKLTKPVQIFDKRIAELELKEPNGSQFVTWGEPRTLVFNASGSGYWVENNEVIDKYLDVLLDYELGGQTILGMLSLEDAMSIKEALLGFFAAAAERLAARKSTASSLAST